MARSTWQAGAGFQGEPGLVGSRRATQDSRMVNDATLVVLGSYLLVMRARRHAAIAVLAGC